MTQDATPTPAVVRRLDSTAALAMSDLAAIFEDLQMTLRRCERLVSELASGEAEPDDLTLEAFWTTAVLSYARCFSHREGGTNLTPDDVTATGLAGDVLGWHQVLPRLRDHYADPAWNPRETFSVGVPQDAYGTRSAIAAANLARVSGRNTPLASSR
jgi:hypothetical protein